MECLSLSQFSECPVMAEATTSNLQPGPGIQKVLKQNSLLDCFFPFACPVRTGLVGWVLDPH